MNEQTGGSQAAQKAGNPLRTVVLVVLLGLMVFALYYDRNLARPASEAAQAQVEKLIEKTNATAGAPKTTDEDVRKLLGRTPTRKTAEHYAVDTFHWRRGFVLLTYKINVVYRKWNDKLILHGSFLNETPLEEDLPHGPIEIKAGKAKPAEATTTPVPGEKPSTPDTPSETPVDSEKPAPEKEPTKEPATE